MSTFHIALPADQAAVMDDHLAAKFQQSLLKYGSIAASTDPSPSIFAPISVPEPANEMKRKRKRKTSQEDSVQKISARKDSPEKLARTLFVGNVPCSACEKEGLRKFRSHFSQYGSIESLRFRSIAFAKPVKNKMRKIGWIQRDFDSDRDTCHAYVVYKIPESVTDAVSANGQLYEGRHLRLDRCDKEKSYDRKRTVFVGNLPVNVTEEELWAAFQNCGAIENVRIVRNKVTNFGKGIAYVQFKERALVPLALELNGVAECQGRKLRVTRCVDGTKKGKIEVKRSEGARRRLVEKLSTISALNKNGEESAYEGNKGFQPNKHQQRTGKRKEFLSKRNNEKTGDVPNPAANNKGFRSAKHQRKAGLVTSSKDTKVCPSTKHKERSNTICAEKDGIVLENRLKQKALHVKKPMKADQKDDFVARRVKKRKTV